MAQKCEKCLSSMATCYCLGILNFKTKLKVYILRHPQEKNKSIATAHLCQLCFKNITIIDAEDFSKNEIINNLSKDDTILVYPKDNFINIEDMDIKLKKSIKNIILLDGTWRKVYKIYMLSQNLQKFTKVAINSSSPSILFLRKPPKNQYLSTYESLIYTLELIENKTFNNSQLPLKYLQDKVLKMFKD